MQKKVAELEGAELDYWVAKAECVSRVEISYGECLIYWPDDSPLKYPYHASSDWAIAGPIIEQEKMSSSYEKTCGKVQWKIVGDNGIGRGESLLIAAMRCYVTSKFGEFVDV
jgi:Protein of unknown function (DUF2591)